MNVPVAVLAVVLTVRVEFAVGVTGLGSAQVAPDGQPVTVSVTLPLNPFNAVAVIVEVPDPPWVRVSDEGLRDNEKSGTGAGLTVSDTVVECTSDPLVPVIVSV